MALSAHGGQVHLLLSLLKTRQPRHRQISIATRARHSFFVVLRGLIVLGDRVPASVALVKATFFQSVVNRHAGIKNKAL